VDELGAVGVLDRCINWMLSVKGSNPVVGKLRNLGVAFGVALLVVVMVLLASAGTGLVDQLHLNAALVRVAIPLALFIVLALICASVFRMLAGERGSWQAALAGGGVSGVILLITPTLAGYYTRWIANNTFVKPGFRSWPLPSPHSGANGQARPRAGTVAVHDS
jgi:uncharacterized BrkB/YihY/UPF0761 family membrane protein